MKDFSKGGALILLLLVALSVLGLVLPDFYLRVIIEIAILGLFAQSLNLILGYGGLISFGHAAFYGFGAYTVAILLRDTGLSLIPAILTGAVLTGIFGLIIGAICLRAAKLYFAILTLAISQLLFVLVFQWYGFTGGDNGIHGVEVSAWMTDPLHYYYFALAAVGLCFFLIRVFLNSPFGYTLRATRDNGERAEFLGVDVWRQRLVTFVLAAAFAGFAGGLYVGYDHMAYPLLVNWSKSAEPLLMVVLGGINSFWGPLVGAVFFVVMEMIMGKVTVYWLFILGLAILILVMFFPKGVWGYVEDKLSPLMMKARNNVN
ncbi:MAG: branched-chain amino acid ABC transporter permease [Deltaproteobacteria bacterium]|nr:branched-chain amino acid ABC transporter permease [Deltaproteobacteria bacterium]